MNVKENLKGSINLNKKDYMFMKRKSNFDLQGEELLGRLTTYQKILCQEKIFRVNVLEKVDIKVMEE